MLKLFFFKFVLKLLMLYLPIVKLMIYVMSHHGVIVTVYYACVYSLPVIHDKLPFALCALIKLVAPLKIAKIYG
jgi:hypothetical protein